MCGLGWISPVYEQTSFRTIPNQDHSVTHYTASLLETPIGPGQLSTQLEMRVRLSEEQDTSNEAKEGPCFTIRGLEHSPVIHLQRSRTTNEQANEAAVG